MISGFQWDDGNWPKCGKHEVSKSEIEHALKDKPFVSPDRSGSSEVRFNAVGRNEAGRCIFVVFTIGQGRSQTWMRPISCRYMHQAEVENYERRRET